MAALTFSVDCVHVRFEMTLVLWVDQDADQASHDYALRRHTYSFLFFSLLFCTLFSCIDADFDKYSVELRSKMGEYR